MAGFVTVRVLADEGLLAEEARLDVSLCGEKLIEFLSERCLAAQQLNESVNIVKCWRQDSVVER